MVKFHWVKVKNLDGGLSRIVVVRWVHALAKFGLRKSFAAHLKIPPLAQLLTISHLMMALDTSFSIGKDS